MTDTFSKAERSRIMAAVKSCDTAPEMTVRRLVHAMGYRFRLHHAGLPGRPDMVFPRLKKIIFVHGCYWHRHACGEGRSRPASNRAYWDAKFDRNRKRDRRTSSALRRLGWSVLVVWECQIKDAAGLEKRLMSFLKSKPSV